MNAHSQHCILCGNLTRRGLICPRCAEQQSVDRAQFSLYSSMLTDHLQTRKAKRSIRIDRNRRYSDHA